MAQSNGSNSVAYFLIGGLLVAVAGFGIYYFTEGKGADKASVEISVDENGIEVEGN